MIGLCCCYAIFGILAIIEVVYSIWKDKRVSAISIVKLALIFAYFVVPICSLIAIINGDQPRLKTLSYIESNDEKYKYITCAITTIFYAIFVILTKLITKKYTKKCKSLKLRIVVSSRAFYIANVVALSIGILALFLYTKAYGSIIGIFPYAERIRDNIFDIQNNLSFFEPITKLIVPATICMIIISIEKKETKLKKAITLCIMLIGLLFSILNLLISDGRMNALCFIAIILGYLIWHFYEVIKKKNLKKSIIFLIVSAGIALLTCGAFTLNATTIMQGMRSSLMNICGISDSVNQKNKTPKPNSQATNKQQASSTQQKEFNNTYPAITQLVAKEFGYIYANNLNILHRLEEKRVELRFGNDLLSIVTLPLPRGLRKNITQNLFLYNTGFTKRAIGQIPTDVITASLYSLSYIGPMVFILLLVAIVVLLDQFFKRKPKNGYEKFFYMYIGWYILSRLILYYDLNQQIYTAIGFIAITILTLILDSSILANCFENLKYHTIKHIDDTHYLKMKFKKRMKKNLDLANPITFNEKLQWLKLHDKNPLYIKMVDKLEAKKYIAKKFGDQYIIPTIATYNNFDEIDFEKLPSQFVIKCTHDSGGLIICRDKAQLDIRQARKRINRALKRNYYWLGREWPYKNVKPRILIEKYMEDDQQQSMRDYKILCFNGQPELLYLSEGLEDHATARMSFYDMNMKRSKISRTDYKPLTRTPQKPKNFNKMKKYAKILAKNIPHMRVDFYEINSKLYFGEITFYTCSGWVQWRKPEYDKQLGDMIDLSLAYDKQHQKRGQKHA